MEAESVLRRTLLDPRATHAARLAAGRVLGQPPHPWWDPNTFAGSVVPGPDRPVMPEEFRLSPSQADSYDGCPRRYVLERRLRLGDPSSPYALFGVLIHEVLERAEREVIGSGENHAELERVLEIVDQVWREMADFGLPALTEAWKQKAIAMLEKLYLRWPGKGEPVDVELGVEHEIAGIRWVGRIDRLERGPEGLRVVDYKTSTSAPNIDDAAESLQLAFYAMAVQDQLGPVSASEMWYPRTDSKSVTTRAVALHQLPMLGERMVEITRDIGDENWEPKVSGACDRCSFRSSCPAWPEGRGAFLP